MEAVVDELGYCRHLLFRASVPTELNLGWVAEVIVFQEVGQTFMNQTSDEFTDTQLTDTHSSPGVDNIPSWFFKNCSYEISEVVTHILNLSFFHW